jgi:hypothetical protein
MKTINDGWKLRVQALLEAADDTSLEKEPVIYRN